jgi:hypothetical protein
MAQAAVAIKGLKETMAALQKIDPVLKAELTKRMGDGARKVRDRAKQRVPDRLMRHYGRWVRGRDGADISWDPGQVRDGIKVSRRGGRASTSSGVQSVATMKLVNMSPMGAIYEMAGSKGGTGVRNMGTQSKTQLFGVVSRVSDDEVAWPQGKQFITNIMGDFGKPPRLLVETWRSMKGITMMAAIAHECARIAEERVQKELNSGS